MERAGIDVGMNSKLIAIVPQSNMQETILTVPFQRFLLCDLSLESVSSEASYLSFLSDMNIVEEVSLDVQGFLEKAFQ